MTFRPSTCSRCREPLTIYEEDTCWECLADELCQQSIAHQMINHSLTPVCKDDGGPGDV